MALKPVVPAVFISGFLGAGKTSFINRILAARPDGCFGIVVNDFGAVPVDSMFLEHNEDSRLRELNNGQIFCSCLASSFVNTVADFTDIDIDWLIIETSGLAKPSSMQELMSGIEKKTGGRFRYGGLVCIVDAAVYIELCTVLNVLNEQIALCSSAVINKTDSVPEERVIEIEKRIRSINPYCSIERAVYGDSGSDPLIAADIKAVPEINCRLYEGWGGHGRPKAFTVTTTQHTSLEAFESAIRSIYRDCYRIKGLVGLEGGIFRIDCTPESFSMVPYGKSEYAPGVVVICSPDEKKAGRIRAVLSGVPGVIAE